MGMPSPRACASATSNGRSQATPLRAASSSSSSAGSVSGTLPPSSEACCGSRIGAWAVSRWWARHHLFVALGLVQRIDDDHRRLLERTQLLEDIPLRLKRKLASDGRHDLVQVALAGVHGDQPRVAMRRAVKARPQAVRRLAQLRVRGAHRHAHERRLAHARAAGDHDEPPLVEAVEPLRQQFQLVPAPAETACALLLRGQVAVASGPLDEVRGVERLVHLVEKWRDRRVDLRPGEAARVGRGVLIGEEG